MSSQKSTRTCTICSKVPTVPKVLPCQHIYCIQCLDAYIRNQSLLAKNAAVGKLCCPECSRPFICLPKPESGCETVGSVYQEFSDDRFLANVQYSGAINDGNRKVMGLAVLEDRLYVVYHQQSTVYMYNITAPYQRTAAADMVALKWPRGMAASCRHQCIYVTDWSSMFAGRLWSIAKNVAQFHPVAELDVQPFGVSVCEATDRVIVACSTPLRYTVPYISNSSRLMIFNAACEQLERIIPLDDSHEIPRYALSVGQRFAVCCGWNKPGKVVLVEESGKTVPGCYGSQVPSGEQSLSGPLSMCDAGEGQILVTDYERNRIHLFTHQLQFVRHLVTRRTQSAEFDNRGVTRPRQICLHTGTLYVGTESGFVGIYKVQP